MYLRNDFRFECAYCRMKEKDNIMGEQVFEKDHFVPILTAKYVSRIEKKALQKFQAELRITENKKAMQNNILRFK